MTFTPLPADPDGFTRAVQTARRRRLRTMGMTTGVAGVTTILVATLLTNGGASSLSQEEPAATDPTPTSTTLALPSADPARPNAATGGTAPTTNPVDGTSSGPTLAPVAGPRSTSAPVEGPAPVRGGYVAGPVMSKQNALDVPNCLGGPGMCGVASHDPNARTLDAYLCSSSPDAYTLHYPDAHEVDLTVLSGKDVRWQWSAFHPAIGAAHTRRLDSGRCTHWWVSYDPVDNQGKALPKGEYVVRATFLAREVDPTTVETTFTVS